MIQKTTTATKAAKALGEWAIGHPNIVSIGVSAVEGQEETLVMYLKETPSDSFVKAYSYWLGYQVKFEVTGEVKAEPAQPDPAQPDLNKKETLRTMIESAINLVSAENESNTPDFILAEFLIDSLAAFDKATKRRTEWYSPATELGTTGGSGSTPLKSLNLNP